MTSLDLVLLLLALLGHGLFWAGVLNRLHSFNLRRRWIKVLNKIIMLLGAGIPVLVAVWLAMRNGPLLSLDARGLDGAASVARAYLGVCWLTAAVGIVVWSVRQLGSSTPEVERSRTSKLFSLANAANGGPVHRHFLTRLPGNQSWQLELVERHIELPRLPPALDGLAILHLSDLHFSGRLDKSYFERAIDVCNQAAADLVAVTGDLLDHADCLAWLPDTLGRLRAPHGVYWIRGNHEVKVDVSRLRETLDACGLVCLGGRWIEVDIGGTRIVLCGNELPWFPPAADLSDCPPPPGGPLRILLAHSPDQFKWARQNQIDLMLAGHVHGGQVRLPVVGAVLSPSWHGVKYACGLFHRPPTVLHVTRGLSGEFPVRYLCRPEVTRLVLRRAAPKSDAGPC